MPLLPGEENIGKNIEELRRSGRPLRVARAIALEHARKSGAKIPKKKRS